MPPSKRQKFCSHSLLDGLCPWSTRADFVGLLSIGGEISRAGKAEIRRLEATLFAHLGLEDTSSGWHQFANHISGHVVADEQEAHSDFHRDAGSGSLAGYVHFDKLWRGRTRRWEIELLAVHVRI